MLPLRLAGAEQEFLAELCSLLRRYLYNLLRDSEDHGVRMESPSVLTDGIDNLLDRFGLTPQALDGLYDRLHRTGANSE